MRKLVTVRKIDDLQPIPGADMIECATIDGWEVVVKKGEFQLGDPCVYFEIDSWLPGNDSRFSFLVRGSSLKKDPSGEDRIRLKTIRLRKQISQGLALPVSTFPEIDISDTESDFSDLLNVIKYERPEPVQGQTARYFPSYLIKTDEDRIQNVFNKYSEQYKDEEYYATLKLDGSSCTIAFLGRDMKEFWEYEEGLDLVLEEGELPKSLVIQSEFGKIGEIVVCSRNLQLKVGDSHFWKALYNGDMINKITDVYDQFCHSIAVQGEVLGPGIQGNKEKLNDYEFYAFNLFNIKEHRYTGYGSARTIFDYNNIQQVPLVEPGFINVFERFSSVKEILEYAEGPSMNNDCREGIVFKPVYNRDINSFKAISNKFLLAGGDE